MHEINCKSHQSTIYVTNISYHNVFKTQDKITVMTHIDTFAFPIHRRRGQLLKNHKLRGKMQEMSLFLFRIKACL